MGIFRHSRRSARRGAHLEVAPPPSADEIEDVLASTAAALAELGESARRIQSQVTAGAGRLRAGADQRDVLVAEVLVALQLRLGKLGDEAKDLGVLLDRAGGELRRLRGAGLGADADEPDASPAGPSGATAAGPEEVSERMRILATQMAVAGATRDEIEARLVSEFAIDDPAAVLAAAGIPRRAPGATRAAG